MRPFLVTPVLNYSLIRSILKCFGVGGVKLGEDLTPWPIDLKETQPLPKHVFGCIERN